MIAHREDSQERDHYESIYNRNFPNKELNLELQIYLNLQIMRIKDKDSIRNILAACKVTPSENIESNKVELKEYKTIQSLHNAKDLAEEVSALANFQGGIIIIGVKDSSNVIGQDWLSQLVGFEHGDVTEIEQRIKER